MKSLELRMNSLRNQHITGAAVRPQFEDGISLGKYLSSFFTNTKILHHEDGRCMQL